MIYDGKNSCKTAMAGVLAAALSSFAFANTVKAETLDKCMTLDVNQTPKKVFEACYHVIEPGQLTGKDLAKALHRRAEALYRLGQVEMAKPDLDRALKLHPDFPEALRRRAYVYMRMQMTNAAWRDAKHAIALDPESSNGHLQLAVLHSLYNGREMRRKLHLRKAVELDPNNHLARLNYANILVATAELEKGLAEFETLLKLPDADLAAVYFWQQRWQKLDFKGLVRSHLANIHQHHNRLQKAEDMFRALSRDYPEDAGIPFKLFGLLSRVGKHGQALEMIDRVIELRPTYLEARLKRAGLYLGLRRFGDARNDLDMLISQPVKRDEAYFLRASLNEAEGFREAALEDMERAFFLNVQFVLRIQRRLIHHGYYTGEPDGVHNEEVRNGLKACFIDPRC